MSSVPEDTDDSEDFTTGAGGMLVGEEGKGTLSSTLLVTVFTLIPAGECELCKCLLSLDLFSLL